MKSILIVLSAVWVLLQCVGCRSGHTSLTGQGGSPVDSKLINTYNDIALQNAIVSQHTLYPYYFVNNSEKLNELGERDLAVLANHFVENPGELNVRKGDIGDDLYKSRVNFVSEKLSQAGVDIERISIEDGMPDGEGMSSERVLKIIQKEDRPSSATMRQTLSSMYSEIGAGK